MIHIGNNKRVIYLGRYKEEIEAAKAYNGYILRHKLNRVLNII